MIFSRKRVGGFAVVVVLAAAVVVAVIGVTIADDSVPRLVGEADQTATQEAGWLATRTAVVKDAPKREATARAFAESFNFGKRDYAALELGEFPVSGFVARSLPELMSRSEVVIIAEMVDGIWFYVPEGDEIPVSVWTVRVVERIKGPIHDNEFIVFHFPGGPVRNPYPGMPDHFLTGPGEPVPRGGDRLVMSLSRSTYDGKWWPSSFYGVLLIRDGEVVDDRASTHFGVTGMTEDELVALLQAAVANSVP